MELAPSATLKPVVTAAGLLAILCSHSLARASGNDTARARGYLFEPSAEFGGWEGVVGYHGRVYGSSPGSSMQEDLHGRLGGLSEGIALAGGLPLGPEWILGIRLGLAVSPSTSSRPSFVPLESFTIVRTVGFARWHSRAIGGVWLEAEAGALLFGTSYSSSGLALEGHATDESALSSLWGMDVGGAGGVSLGATRHFEWGPSLRVASGYARGANGYVAIGGAAVGVFLSWQ